jgi:hypothetical protein
MISDGPPALAATQTMRLSMASATAMPNVSL